MPPATPNRWRRSRVAQINATVAILAAMLAMLGLPAAASAASTCSGQALTVTSLQGVSFYTDGSYTSMYFGYRISNTGSARTNLWVQVGNISVATITLGTGETGRYPLGPLAGGDAGNAYFYLNATTTAVNGAYDVTVWSGKPGAGGTLICTETQSVTTAASSTGGSSTISSITPPATVQLGQTFQITVNGNTGPIGSGNFLRFTPASGTTWQPTSFRLVGVDLTMPFSNNAAATTQSHYLGYSGIGTSKRDYTLVYTFQAVDSTSANTPLSPIVHVAGGSGQVRYDDPVALTGAGINPIPTVVNTLTVPTLSSDLSGRAAPGDSIAMQAVVSNTSAASLKVDEIVVDLPASSWSASAGTSTFGGSAIANPSQTGSTLHFVGPYTVPASGTATLSFTAVAGTSGGTASAYAILNSAQIDTTLTTSDDAKATTSLPVVAAPVAVADSVTAASGVQATISVLGNDNLDGETGTVTITSSPSHGSASVNGSGQVLYTATGNYSGADSLTYKVTTRAGNSSAAVSITVVAPVPVAVADTATVPSEGGAQSIDVLANDSLYGKTVTAFSITSGPSHGSASTTGGNLISYTPTFGYTGSDSITYSVSTDAPGTSSATLTITVADQAPVLVADTVSVAMNGSVDISPMANDNLRALVGTLAISSAPMHGGATVSAGTITYTPTTGWYGADSIGYEVSTSGGTRTQTISVTVVPPAPTASADTLTVAMNSTATDVDVLANDTTGGLTATVTITSGPAHGTASVVAGKVRYEPAAGWYGGDSLTYQVATAGGSSTASLSITVQAPAPVAAADSTTVTNTGSGATALNVLGNDSTGGLTATVLISSPPTHGTAEVGAGNSIEYTPAAGYAGSDSLTYTVTTAGGSDGPVSVDITVEAAAPVATDDSLELTANAAEASIDVLANDALYGFSGALTISNAPAHGSARESGGTIWYTVDADWAGSDALTYEVQTAGGTASGVVSITVTADAPVAVDDAVEVLVDGIVDIDVLANDMLAGLPATVTILSGPSHGSAEVAAGGGISYSPAAAFSGSDSLSYELSTIGGTSTADVTITVVEPGLPPTAADDEFDVHANSSANRLDVLANDTTAAAVVVITIASAPTSGAATVSSDGAAIEYTPADGYVGDVTLAYQLTTVNGSSQLATVTIGVTALAPVAAGDTASVLMDGSVDVDVLANDQLDGLAGTVEIVADPSHGTATVDAGGAVTYAPATGYIGPDSVGYRVTTAAGTSSTATLAIDVLPPPPVAAADDVATTINTPTLIDVRSNDELYGQGSTIVITSAPVHGTASIVEGSISYAPATDFVGVDSLEYEVTTTAGSSAALVSIEVTAQAPTVTSSPLALELIRNGSIDIAPTQAIDHHGLTRTVAIAAAPGHGSVDVAEDDTITYTPDADYYGTDSFTFTVTTPGGSADAVVELTIIPPAPAGPATVATTVPAGAASNIDLAAQVQTYGLSPLASISVAPLHGTGVLDADGRTLHYTPAAGFVGYDSVTYDVTTDGGSVTIVLSITVGDPSPVAVDDAASVVAGNDLSFDVLANDEAYGLDATLEVVSVEPGRGSASINGGLVAYEAEEGWAGEVTITYRITTVAGSATADLVVTVSPPAPLLVPETATVKAGSTIVSCVLDNDGTGGFAASLELVDPAPAHGVATIIDGCIAFTAEGGWTGEDEVAYRVVVIGTDPVAATLPVTITPADPVGPPVDDVQLDANGATLYELPDDPALDGIDPDLLELEVTSPPAHGRASVVGRGIAYEPDPDYAGTDEFEYRVLGPGARSRATGRHGASARAAAGMDELLRRLVRITVHPTAPAPPQSVRVRPGSGGGSVINWTPPRLNGGAVITGYRVVGADGRTLCTTAAANRACRLPRGVDPATVLVLASNSVGESRSDGGGGAGGAPLIGRGVSDIRALPVGSGVRIAWRAPRPVLRAGRAVYATSYIVRMTDAGGRTGTCSTTETWCLVRVRPGGALRVRVTARFGSRAERVEAGRATTEVGRDASRVGVVHFAPGSALVGDRYARQLADLARTAAYVQVRRMAVAGHADSAGTWTANLELSRRRAIETIMTLKRFEPSLSISSSWWSDSRPVKPVTGASWHNRRAEVNAVT